MGVMNDGHEIVYGAILLVSVGLPSLFIQYRGKTSNKFITATCGLLSGIIIVLWALVETNFSADVMIFSPMLFAVGGIVSYLVASFSCWLFRRSL